MTQKPNNSSETVRLDIWLWATRLFKTRSTATDACKRNQVSVNGQKVKPSRQVRVGDRIEFKRGPLIRTVEVKGVISKRVGASLVDDFLIDHTSESEYLKAAEISRENRTAKPRRNAGAGRPTKKNRRDLNEAMNDAADNAAAFEAFSKAMKKNITILVVGFLVLSGIEIIAQDKAPPKRSFKVKEGIPALKLNEQLIVYAQMISPVKNAETGALTSMAATGDVLIKAKPKGAKNWILVACDKAIYDPVGDSIKLTGFPAVKSGMQIVRATDAKTYVSVNRATGKWEIKGPHKIEVSLGGFKKR